MSTMEILENRISSLEKQIYGPCGTPSENDNTVVENILHANTLISSALSGREKMNNLLGRLDELDTYIDPKDDEVPLDVKLQLIKIAEPQIQENYQNLEKLKNLSVVFESDRFRDVGEMSQKLNGLSLTYLQAHSDLEELNDRVQDMFIKYNNILSSISNTLQTMEATVATAELEALWKKRKE